jgi:hypothetical protein
MSYIEIRTVYSAEPCTTADCGQLVGQLDLVVLKWAHFAHTTTIHGTPPPTSKIVALTTPPNSSQHF